MPIFAVSPQNGAIVNSVNSEVSGLNVTKIVYNVHSFYLIFWNRNCDIAIHFQMAAQQNRLVHKKMPIYHSPVMAATSMTTFLAAWHTQIIYCLYLNLSVVCKLWFIEKLIRDESIKYFWLYIKSAAVPTQQLECLFISHEMLSIVNVNHLTVNITASTTVYTSLLPGVVRWALVSSAITFFTGCAERRSFTA